MSTLVAIGGLTSAALTTENPFVNDNGQTIQPMVIDNNFIPDYITNMGLIVGGVAQPYDNGKKLLEDFVKGAFAKGMGLASFGGISSGAKLMLNDSVMGWKAPRVERDKYGLRSENFSQYYNHFKHEATLAIVDFVRLVAADTKAIEERLFIKEEPVNTEDIPHIEVKAEELTA